MDSDAQEKLLFRMNHLIPRGFSATHPKANSTQNSAETLGPEEIQMQMTWGKVAGGVKT